jgi:tyrosine-protein kinase
MTDSLFVILWRRRILLLVTFILALFAVGLGTAVLPKSYESTSYIRVGASGGGDAGNYESTQVNQVLLRTYAELLQTRQVIEAAAADRNVGLSADEVAQRVSVSPVEQSQLITVHATGASPTAARVLATTYATVGIGQTSAKADAKGASAVVAQPGAEIAQPVWPRPTLNLLVGALLVAALAVGVALVVDRLDPRVGKVREGRLLGLPLLGRLTKAGGPERGWREAASRLILTHDRVVPTSIAVVCVDSVERIADHCLLFARMVSEFGRPTVVVDADVARQVRDVSRSGRPGLVEYLTGQRTDLLRLLQPSTWPRLNTLPAGAVGEALPLLTSPAMANLDAELRGQGLLAVYQVPPLSADASAVAAAGVADVVVLVVTEGRTHRAAVETAVADLARIGGRVAGVVMIGTRAAGRLPAGNSATASQQVASLGTDRAAKLTA